MMNRLFTCVVVACVVSVSGCSAFKPPPDLVDVLNSAPERPTIGEARQALRSLPAPSGRITAAVYGFGDLTGQNRPAPASGLSTAVTQGASNSLIGLMLESGWFRPVERVGLQSVLSERNLWDQRLRAEQGGALAPLPPASILFEGGIVSYESNVRSGGFGAQYLGVGGSTEYREDVLTVSLRAVNAQTGAVLNSVSSTKRVFSRTLNAGIFSFVGLEELLETEAGWASNESVQVGLEEALASALIDLIAGGLIEGNWQLAEIESIRSESFARYIDEGQVESYLAQARKRETEIPALGVDDEVQELETLPEVEEPEGLKPLAEAQGSASNEAAASEVASDSQVVATSRSKNDIAQEPSALAKLQKAVARAKLEQESRKATEVPNELLSTKPAVEEPSAGTSVSAGSTQATTASEIQYLIVGYSEERQPIDGFQQWLDERYDGVPVAVIRSSDAAGYQVAIGPFDEPGDVGLVSEDLKNQGIPIAEAVREVIGGRRIE